MLETGDVALTTAEIFDDRDRFMRLVGMQIVPSARGTGQVRLEIVEQHLNIYGSVHGGVILTLADEAFGVAVTSLGRCIGVQWSLNITRAPRRGDVLLADSSTIHEGTRTVVCEVTVRDQREKLVAVGTATALVLGGSPDRGNELYHVHPEGQVMSSEGSEENG